MKKYVNFKCFYGIFWLFFVVALCASIQEEFDFNGFISKETLEERGRLLLKGEKNSFPSILSTQLSDVWFGEGNYETLFQSFIPKQGDNNFQFPANIYTFEEAKILLNESVNLSFLGTKKSEHELPIIGRNMRDNEDLAVLGDLHGGSTSAVHFLEKIRNKENLSGVILGDVLDRSYSSFNTLLYVIHQCLLHKKSGESHKLVPVRGDHENKEHNNRKDGCFNEVVYRYGLENAETLFSKLYKFFDRLPVAYYMKSGDKVILCSHALIHVDDVVLRSRIGKDGLDPREQWAMDDNKVQLDLKDQIEANNVKNVKTLLNTTNSSAVFSHSYVGVMDGDVKNCGYTVGKFHDDTNLASNEVSNMSIDNVRDWIEICFKRKKQKLHIFSGHNHKMIGYPSFMKAIDRHGYEKYIIDDNTDVFTLGPAVRETMYQLPYVVFPYGNFRGSSIYPGIIRQYALIHRRDPDNSVFKMLVDEDKDSPFSSVHMFIKNKLEHELLYKRLQSSEQINACEQLCSDFLEIEFLKNFVIKFQNFLDQNILLSTKQEMRYDPQATIKQVNTKCFIRIINEIIRTTKEKDIDKRFTVLTGLSTRISSCIKTFSDPGKDREQLDKDFANHLRDFTKDLLSNIDNHLNDLSNQYNILKQYEEYNESWNDFCLNILGLKEPLPISLSFTDGFATYSQNEKGHLRRLLLEKNEALKNFVNQPQEFGDKKGYLNCLVTNVFASLNCCSESESEWLEWISLEAKKRIVECLVSFLEGNQYLSINSKIQILSNIAFFYKSEEYGNFPVSFKDIKTMLEEQLIYLCDVGFACETPVDDFSQIFYVLSKEEGIELINHLLSAPIQNKKQQGDICMKSLFGPMYSKDLLVPINKVLPYLIDNFPDLDPETFEDFCRRGFRCEPKSFLNFFDRFLIDNRLHNCLRDILKFTFIIELFQGKDHMNQDDPDKVKMILKERVKAALNEVEKSIDFDRTKSEMVDIILRMSRYNDDVLEFCVSHATTEEQLLRLARLFDEDLYSFGSDRLNLKQLKIAYKKLDTDQAAMDPGSSNGKKVLAMADKIERVEISLVDTRQKIAHLYGIFRKKNIGYLDIALTLYDQIWQEGTVDSDKNMFKDYVEFLILTGKNCRGEYRNNSFFGCVDSAGKKLSDADIPEVQKRLKEIDDVWLRDYVVLNIHLYPYVSKYFNDLLIDVKPENFVEFVNVVNTQTLQVYYDVQQDSLINLFHSNKEVLHKFIVFMLNVKDEISDNILKALVSNDLILKKIDSNFLLNALEQAIISCLQEQESILDLLKKICNCFNNYHSNISDFIQREALKLVEKKDRQNIDLLFQNGSLVDALNAIETFLAGKTSSERIAANAVVSDVLSINSFDPLIQLFSSAQDKVAALALDLILTKQQGIFGEKHMTRVLLQALIMHHDRNAGKKIISLLVDKTKRLFRSLNHYVDISDLLFDAFSKYPELCPDELFPLTSWSSKETVDQVFKDKDMFCFLCDLFFRNKIDYLRVIRLDAKLLQNVFSIDDSLKYIVKNTALRAKDVSVFAAVFVDEDFMQKPLVEVDLDFISWVANMIVSVEVDKIFVPEKTLEEQSLNMLCVNGVEIGKNLWKLYDRIEKLVLDLSVDRNNYIKIFELLLQLPRAAIVLKRYANRDEYKQCIKRVIGACKKIHSVVIDHEKTINTVLTKSRSFLSATTIPDELNDLRHQFCFEIAHDFILDGGIAHDHSHLLLQEPVNPLLFFFNFAERWDELRSYLDQYPASYIVDLLSKKARLNEQEKKLCSDYIKDNPLQKPSKIDYQKNIRKKLLLREGDKTHRNEIIIEEIIGDNTGKKSSKTRSPKYGLVSHLSKTQVAVGLTSLIAIASIVWFKPYQAPLVQKIKSYFLWRLGFSQD